MLSVSSLVGDSNSWLEIPIKAWARREKRERKVMTAPGTRRSSVKGREESRVGEGESEALAEVRRHGQELQQVTGVTEGGDWGHIIIPEHSAECITEVPLMPKLSIVALHFKAMGLCSLSGVK